MLLDRNTLTAEILLPKPLPFISRTPLRPGLAEAGRRLMMVGAVLLPSVYSKLRLLTVKDPTATVTV